MTLCVLHALGLIVHCNGLPQLEQVPHCSLKQQQHQQRRLLTPWSNFSILVHLIVRPWAPQVHSMLIFHITVMHSSTLLH